VVEKREVRLPEGTIRTTGEHVIDIHLYTDVDAVITISVVGEE
jgi:large subunit ribosomal protein L9